MDIDSFEKCKIEPKDIINAGNIINQLKSASIPSDDYYKKLQQLKGILNKYKAEHYKCLIDENFGKQYKNFCQDKEMKTKLYSTLKLTENIIDHYGADIIDILNYYTDIIINISKQCDDSKDKNLVNQAQRVSHKLFVLLDKYKKRNNLPNGYTEDSFIIKKNTLYMVLLIAAAAIYYFFFKNKDKNVTAKK